MDLDLCGVQEIVKEKVMVNRIHRAAPTCHMRGVGDGTGTCGSYCLPDGSGTGSGEWDGQGEFSGFGWSTGEGLGSGEGYGSGFVSGAGDGSGSYRGFGNVDGRGN